MKKYYGLDRVLEPKGMVPATAWKLDNGKNLGPKEVRICLERIHLEWGNFQQICSSCGFDEAKMRVKIMDIIEKRGKLHNPFTGSGGVLIGTIDEIPEASREGHELKEGDRIYCITSLSCIPIYIEDIFEIDFNYGQIVCSGYAILFEASPVYRMEKGMQHNYTLAAIDEAGSLFGAYNIAVEHKNQNIIVIGRKTYTVAMYAEAVREATGASTEVIAIMDKHAKEILTQEEIEKALSPLVKATYFVDLTDPVNAFHGLLAQNSKLTMADQVIVAENIFGSETLAVMLVKSFGDLYFTAVENHYSEAQLVAESMGKIVTMYAFDQYVKDYPEFTIRIVKSIKPILDTINHLYIEREKQWRRNENREKSMIIENAGKLDNFVYQSQVTRSMVDEVLNIAKYDCNVIIQGETGVGKERVLSLIHQNSERCGNPCIKINCATIAESLAESEFFGYEAGAFTGAQTAGKPGYFEMANKGILFLDEIGTLSMNMQSKLLRVLQENQFYRVGGTHQVSVNVRVIVANNIPLKELVDAGKFREDLYYRLNICKIDVPPLRERRADILCLATTFAANWAKKYNISKELSQEALDSLYDYYWPGNVRELENVIHRLVISSKDVVIGKEDVDEILGENDYDNKLLNMKKHFDRNENLDFHQLMDQQEKLIIEYALKQEGTTRKAADLLGLPQTTFARKKLKYGL
ncbi:MAG: sigma-54 interaction domain-containing protein [Emergencia sp.]|nr:sigma-54 dependent transcriptional regulator [Emergencia sp.]